MSMRSLAWHDLLKLYRCRNQMVFLDSALTLTHGSPVGPLAVLSHLSPSHDSFTGVAVNMEDGSAYIGQVCHHFGEQMAHMTFIAPLQQGGVSALFSLIEGLACQVVEWGACRLLLEVNEDEPLFEALRRSGLSIYGWQRIWRMPQLEEGHGVSPCYWESAVSADEIAIRSLYHSLTPPLMQRAEPMTTAYLHGMAFRQNGEMMGYVDGSIGPQGIFLRPIIHPGVEHIESMLRELPTCWGPLLGRPVYLVVRSNQAWLEMALSQLNATETPRQALMVRHIAKAQRVSLTTMRLPVLETSQAEGTVPVARSIYDN